VMLRIMSKTIRSAFSVRRNPVVLIVMVGGDR
jgi:hypothetical protein